MFDINDIKYDVNSINYIDIGCKLKYEFSFVIN